MCFRNFYAVLKKVLVLSLMPSLMLSIMPRPFASSSQPRRPQSTIISLHALLLLTLPTLIQAVVIFDYSSCAAAANATFSQNPNSIALRDQNGLPTSNFSKAWGVSYESCNEVCQGGAKAIEWNSFSLQFASWLLPWLALTAQLPFETKSRACNAQSLFLAIGSPFLIIYSLALTILNARSINREFRELREENEELICPSQIEVIKAARVVLIESQSIPLQIVNGPDREFAQLIVNPANLTWWTSVVGEILKTKREWTYSLIVQLVMVVIAQGLSIIDYVTSPADDDTISVGLAVNSLWIWMIPVAFGWVKIGTQTSAGSIKAALKSAPVPVLVTRFGTTTNVSGKCIGIRDRTHYARSYQRWTAPPRPFGGSYDESGSEDETTPAGMVRLEDLAQRRQELLDSTQGSDPCGNNATGATDVQNRSQTPEATSRSDDRDSDQDLELLLSYQPDRSGRKFFAGFSVDGDDAEPGPIFNYARVWAHMTAVSWTVKGLSQLTKQQKKMRCVDRSRTWIDTNLDGNLAGTKEEMTKYIFKQDREFLPVHSQPLQDARWNCVKASIVAIILGWGTTGAGLLIAYKYILSPSSRTSSTLIVSRTPTVGLGCNSGAYLIYGVVATAAWFLLVFSAYLSHLHNINLESPSPYHTPFRAPAAILTRLAGKSLACLNTCFLFVTSVLQFTNLYNNCWCSAAVAGLGREKGWVILFATDAQIAAAAKTPWIVGICLGIFVGLGTLVWILGERGDDIFRKNRQ